MIDRERDPFDCCGAELDTADELNRGHENRPGLPALSYRLGRHGDFFARMLDRLPNERNGAGVMSAPPLGRLTYRGNDDPTIALLDAGSSLLDVLAFYQERIVNEGFIRTVLERRSMLELARSIGYEMRPGVAASTLLAFTVDGAPGSPDRVTVPVGTQVLSIPKKDELPQTFETIEPLDARVEWNSMGVHTPWTTMSQSLETGSQVIYLERQGPRLSRGDVVLVVDEGADDVRLLRRVHRVTDVPSRGYRKVELQPTDVEAADSVPLVSPRIFAFGLRARFFGHDAPPADSRAIEIQRIFAAGIPTPVQCVALAPGGVLGASGFEVVPEDLKVALTDAQASLWQTIRIWNLDEDRLHRTLVNEGTVTALAFSPDDDFLAATTSENGNIYLRVWKVSGDRPVASAVLGLAPAEPPPPDPAEPPPPDPAITFTFREPDGLGSYCITTIDADKQAVLWNVVVSSSDEAAKVSLHKGDTLDLSSLGDFTGDARQAERQDADGKYSLVGGELGATIYRARELLDEVPENVEPIDEQLDLDNVYRKLVPGGWMLIEEPSTPSNPPEPPHTAAFEIRTVSTHYRSDFGISKRVSRLGVAIGDATFSLRDSEIYAESDELTLATVEVALPEAIEGKVIPLAEGLEGLEGLEGRSVIVQGRPVRVSADDKPLLKVGSSITAILPGDKTMSLTVAAVDKDNRPVRLIDENGFAASFDEGIDLVIWDEDIDPVHEVVEVEAVDNTDSPPWIRLVESLQNVYDWRSVRILGNVAVATHGETVTEVLGSGDGLARNQRFKLSKPPLTFVPAPNESGRASTLQVRVNGVLWEERGSLLQAEPADEVYVVRIQNDGTTEITFGDGVRGARLPSGAENVVATYRSGLGFEGEVEAGQLALLKTKPLGIREVNNPLPATGAEPPEAEAETRENAPRTVLVLGRVVSIQDYEDFCEIFPGVGKAQAMPMWDGTSRLVHLTIGTESGSPIIRNSPLYDNLVGALDNVRDIHQLMRIDGYEERRFGLSAKVLVDERYLAEPVLAAIRSRLVEAFSYHARSFGQDVTAAEIMAAIHEIAGVVAVDLDAVYFVDEGKEGNGSTAPTQRLGAKLAYLEDGEPKPAELLVIDPSEIELIDPSKIELKEMS